MTWSRTRSGKQFNYLRPTQASICIEDIALGLSKECRFNGQCIGFYSVAQHSTLIAQIVEERFAMEALLHDATEFVCKDITSPHKRLMPDYQIIENRVARTIRRKFGLPLTMSPEVKHADRVMLATEYRDLMPEYQGDIAGYADGVRPLDNLLICPLTHEESYHEFLSMFRFLEAI